MVNKRFSAAVLAIVLIASWGNFLSACGDKFLVPSRGSRSQRPGTAPEHAAILIYDSGSDLLKGLPNTSVNDVLSQAGYRPTAVTSKADLERELKKGHWDAILIGIADAPWISGEVRGNAQAPVVVPVTYNATDAQVRDTRKQYAVVVRFPAKRAAFLTAVDKALNESPRPSKSI